MPKTKDKKITKLVVASMDALPESYSLTIHQMAPPTGESLFTPFASLKYAYHYLMKPIK